VLDPIPVSGDRVARGLAGAVVRDLEDREVPLPALYVADTGSGPAGRHDVMTTVVEANGRSRSVRSVRTVAAIWSCTRRALLELATGDHRLCNRPGHTDAGRQQTAPPWRSRSRGRGRPRDRGGRACTRRGSSRLLNVALDPNRPNPEWKGQETEEVKVGARSALGCERAAGRPEIQRREAPTNHRVTEPPTLIRSANNKK
jgi:hypothetical protein